MGVQVQRRKCFEGPGNDFWLGCCAHCSDLGTNHHLPSSHLAADADACPVHQLLPHVTGACGRADAWQDLEDEQTFLNLSYWFGDDCLQWRYCQHDEGRLEQVSA